MGSLGPEAACAQKHPGRYQGCMSQTAPPHYTDWRAGPDPSQSLQPPSRNQLGCVGTLLLSIPQPPDSPVVGLLC